VAPVMRIVRSVKESARSACCPMVHGVPPDPSPSNNVQMRPRRHVHASGLTARRRAGQAAPHNCPLKALFSATGRAAHARTPAAMSLFPESDRFGDVRRLHASVALPTRHRSARHIQQLGVREDSQRFGSARATKDASLDRSSNPARRHSQAQQLERCRETRAGDVPR